MSATIALLAHAPDEHPDETARDAVAVALAFLVRDHSLLLHASANLGIPLLLTGQSARAPVVLEGSVRRPHPITLMAVLHKKGPEGALLERVELGAGASREGKGGDLRTGSLLERLEALGIVDASAARREASVADMLRDYQPAAIVATGWSEGMRGAVRAAEEYGERTTAALVVAGPRSGLLREAGHRWLALDELVDFEPKDVPLPGLEGRERPEGLTEAWSRARREARIAFLAEMLAIRIEERGTGRGTLS